MKKQFLIALCSLLTAFFCNSVCEAQTGPQLGTHVNLTYSEGNFNISKTNFNSSAKSIKVFFDFGEPSINWGNIAYNRYNAMDPNTTLVSLNSSQRYYTIIVTKDDIIKEITTNSGISVNYGDARTIKVIITNYETVDGAANDNNEESGIEPSIGGNGGSPGNPSGGSGGGFTGDKVGGYTAEELKGQYNPIDKDKVNLIISKRRQISNLPTIYITIPDAERATNQEELNKIVNKDDGVALYHTASIKVVDDNNESLSFEDDALEIKVRGNETARGTKKPYRLKFGKDEKDEAGNVTKSHKHDMLGYGYEKRNWTLIANEKDGSFCHNALSYHIGKAVGMEFCPGYRFVDLVINDIYLGCYMVSDHVEVGSNRIKLEDENTGWYVESNRDDQYEAPYLLPTQGSGIYISIKNPEFKDTDPDYATKVAALQNDINTYFSQAKTVIDKFSSDITLFRDHENGWRKYFDEESLVKYYVGTNLSGNHDGFMTVKMYRDLGKKVKIGPLWDHDTAFGIYDDGETLSEDAQSSAPLFCGKYAKIIADNDPEFMQKANYLLQKVLADGFEENMISHIADITSSVATSRTIEKPYGDPFQTEITKLENYITAHNSWLRETVNTKAGGKTIVFPEEQVTPPTPTRAQLTNLPTIYLDATVGNDWSTATVQVFDSENKLTQGTEWTNSALEVQYQGSGDKNKDSYRLKFGAKTQLLSSGSFKQWVLLANDDDPTMMRNALAKEMGDALGLPFTPGYQFVDLYVNDQYKGTYQVTDRIKVEKGRALVSGGNKDLDWHVRLNDQGEFDEDKPTYYIAGTTSMPYIIPKNPDPKDDVTTWNSTLKSDMTSYFNNVFSKDAEGKYTALTDNVDKQQLIQWYIAQEILCVYKGFSSIEAYRSTTATDKNLHIGVIWDSEKAFGNTGEAPGISMSDLNSAGSYDGLMTNYAAYDVMKTVFTQLWQQPWFARGVKSLWDEKHEAMLTALNAKITSLQSELSESWTKNATQWSVTGEQAASINAMKTWLTQRDAYLTKKFAALAAALPCENHTYENHNYIEQTNGTFLLGCDVCGAIKEDSKTYYKFTVYPESADAIEVIATSWQPSDKHPNSIAVVEAEKKIVEKINGYNIVCGKKSTLSDGTKGLTCKDFRLTDGHPYYSDNKFVATQATYTRNLGENEEYGMMCIPFKHQQAVNDDAAFYHIESVDDGKIKLVAIDPSIEGNSSAYLPVIFKRKTDMTSITVKGTDVTVKKTSADKYNSTYEGWTLTGVVESQSVNADRLYLLYDFQQGKLVRVTEANITPFRAYLSTTATDALQTLYFVVMGDVNGDVVVDNLDVEELVKIIVNSSSLPVNANVNFNADLDGDGKITLSDVTSLVEKLNK